MIIDLHSHILPGIDDGAKSWDDFLRMAEIAVAEGITHMVCTPHYIQNETKYTKEIYYDLLNQAKQKLEENRIRLILISGCEFYFTAELPAILEQDNLLTINDSGKYLLMEFPRMEIPSYTTDLIFELKLKGITPIIAHPERNMALSKNPEVLVNLIEQGALCQMNTGSITGSFGRETKKIAFQLLSSGMIHFLGSDAHSPRSRTPKFKQACAVIKELVGKDRLDELVMINPLKVLNNLEVEPYQINLQKEKLNLWSWFLKNLKFSS